MDPDRALTNELEKSLGTVAQLFADEGHAREVSVLAFSRALAPNVKTAPRR
jgi:hypothetical protein